MKTILITGAAGFIGSHLTEVLLARGDRVIGVDDFNDFYDPQVKRANVGGFAGHPRFSLQVADIRHESRVRAIFSDVRPDVVVHLAARAGVRPSLADPNLYHEVNVIGSQHILDACQVWRPSHLVFASSSSVYGGIRETPFTESMDVGRPVSPYAATKRMNELMGHVYSAVYGLNVTMLRFFTVYGPRQRPDMAISKFTRLALAGRPIPMFGDGSTQRDYTYIDDIIGGLVKAVDTPFRFEIFNLGESRVTRLQELVELIGRALGRTLDIEPLPPQPGDVAVTYADISKARRMLGYEPKYPIEDGIASYIEWVKQR